MTELTTKLDRVRSVMALAKCDVLWLRRLSHVAWLTGGARGYIDVACDTGVLSLCVSQDAHWALTTNIEAKRLRDEERLGGWEIRAQPWFAAASPPRAQRLGGDLFAPGATDLHNALIAARAPLLNEEIARYRLLGRDMARAMTEAALRLRPGMTEHAVAAMLAEGVYGAGAVPTVVLVAGDQRLEQYRHPLPTDKLIERRAMLVLCGRRDGLVVSLTRFVSLGQAASPWREKLRAVAHIDAAAIDATRPGVMLGDIFARIVDAYARHGFADAWKEHHQGGPCSYDGRDIFVTPGEPEQVASRQAFAWNPSVPGAKSEDTILVDGSDRIVLTDDPRWPVQTATLPDGSTLRRPDALTL